MEEIINSILEAETKAQEIIENAINSSKKSSLTASDKSFQIKEDAVKKAKDAKKADVDSANKKADSEYTLILSKGKDRVEDYKKQVSSKIDEVADEVFKEIIK